MHEILDHLPDGARVLDLGARDGSFPAAAYERLLVVRADIMERPRGDGRFVQADAASLPFRSRAFDAVILNHCLEHFARLKTSLQEIGRVVRRDGAVFVAIPDARTLTDRIYRKLYWAAGGHVNLFGSAGEAAKMFSWYFGLPHVATRTLCTSLVFLNRTNVRHAGVRLRMRWRGLYEPIVALAAALFRRIDRRLRTRTSVYGWAFYFGTVGEKVDLLPRINVCVRCGQGIVSEWLVEAGMVRRRRVLWDTYRCPDCGAINYYSRDDDFGWLK